MAKWCYRRKVPCSSWSDRRPGGVILHRSIERDGTWVPRCNIHNRSHNDKGRTREFRAAEAEELAFKVCGRCDGQMVMFK